MNPNGTEYSHSRKGQVPRKCKCGGANVTANDSTPFEDTATEYQITFAIGLNYMIVPYWQGIGRTEEPTGPEVLNCLILDAMAYDSAADFSEWCGELGYSDDSIKARDIWEACGEISRKLRRLVGNIQYAVLMGSDMERL